MEIIAIAVCGLLAGMLLGLGGTGASSLTVPFLTFFTSIRLIKAITANMAASLALKSLAASLYLRKRTINYKIVIYLLIGSIPAVLIGSLLLARAVKDALPQRYMDETLGILLSVSTMLMMVSIFRNNLFHRNRPEGTRSPSANFFGNTLGNAKGDGKYDFGAERKLVKEISHRNLGSFVARRSPSTAKFNADKGKPVSFQMKAFIIFIGALSGFLFGITSIGSGSLIISLLGLCFPEMEIQELVAIDLLQAIPLGIAGTTFQFILIRPDMHLSLLLVLLGIPGVFCGWLLSRKLNMTKIKYFIAGISGLSGILYLHRGGSLITIYLVLSIYLLETGLLLFSKEDLQIVTDVR